jgi:hypothetical protein
MPNSRFERWRRGNQDMMGSECGLIYATILSNK